MKKLILTISMLTVGLAATDFSQMTMEQLNAMRGTVATEERDAFRAEMQNRLKAMSPEERQAYAAARRKNADKGQGTMQRLRDGSGSGIIYRGGGRR
ncbi:DUF1104 domain-containing protein [Sulfurovum sp. ST-21]|uniref:DUF1104 domain-containing protein n=1 Tax=Sulfurovum indicum TaxID=2779528 RepID=A0A7M1S730_9BACT|nr:DUF1104 domain-containing protein [Sulfurovum indicum]QOR62160.1 DUF1104 domain-containing protein [Sulfurovum indicum]